MVVPGAYSGRMKQKGMSYNFDAAPTSSKTQKERAVPLVDHPTPTNLTLKFDTNVRLQRNNVLAAVTILNAFVAVALIAAVMPTGVYIYRELNYSQHKIEVLQDQVKFLTKRYVYVLKQLGSVTILSKRSSLYENLGRINNDVNFLVSAQYPSPSQDMAVNAVKSADPSGLLQTSKGSLIVNHQVNKEQSSTDALANNGEFQTSLSEEHLLSRRVAVDTVGSHYGTRTLRRTKRSDRRGKQSKRKPSNGGRGRQRRRGKLSGTAVAHFKGGQPETFIRDGGLVAPWFLDDAAAGQFGLSTIQLKQGKAAVEVTEGGLYYIYSQIHYLTSQVTNSYSLNLRRGSQTNSSVLSYCSASSGSETLNEVSCFTSVVRYLNSTDRIFIQQRDMNRRIILRDGYSYLGIVRLTT